MSISADLSNGSAQTPHNHPPRRDQEHLTEQVLLLVARQVVVLPEEAQTHLSHCTGCQQRLEWQSCLVDAARQRGWTQSPLSESAAHTWLERWLEGDRTPELVNVLKPLMHEVPVIRDLAQVMVVERLIFGLQTSLETLEADVGVRLIPEGVSPLTLEPEVVALDEAPDELLEQDLEPVSRPFASPDRVGPASVTVGPVNVGPVNVGPGNVGPVNVGSSGKGVRWRDQIPLQWLHFWKRLWQEAAWTRPAMGMAVLLLGLGLTWMALDLGRGRETPVPLSATGANPGSASSGSRVTPTPEAVAVRGETRTTLQSVQVQRFKFNGEGSLEPVGMLTDQPSVCRPGDRLHFVAAPLGDGYLSLWEQSPTGALRILARHPLGRYLGGEVEVGAYSAAGAPQTGDEPIAWPEVPTQRGNWTWILVFSQDVPPIQPSSAWLENAQKMEASIQRFTCESQR